MAAFDFDSARRWARFDPYRTLAGRSDDELPFVKAEQVGGRALLLDTCVYIDRVQGRSPGIVARIIQTRQVNHSTIVIQELMHAVGALDPADARTPAAIGAIRGAIRSMRMHRVFAPEPDVLGKAALLAGMLCRLQGYAADARLRALQECALFLQAQKLGLTVLTADIGDYDYLLQLIPAGRVLFYRRS